MKRILITGGAGFIGSAMVRYLSKDINLTILNIDKLTYAGNTESIKIPVNESASYNFLKLDICDQTKMKDIFLDFQPDAVINFAAESHVDRSIDDPSPFITTNILGTFSLLEATRAYLSTRNKNFIQNFRFHHVSTDEVFGSLGEQDTFNEQTAYDPRSPYSASKASSDHLVRAWYHTYNIPISISNCSNNYGPYHYPEKLIPLMILNALHEKNLTVYGNGGNVRDWLFVDDHVKAIWLIVQKGVSGETYNIGSRSEFTNNDIVNKICDILDQIKPRKNNQSYKELICFVKDRMGHDFRYAIDPHKIESELKWSSLQTFESGLRYTVQWYIDNPEWWGPLWHPNQ